jgi:hypothetical protein
MSYYIGVPLVLLVALAEAAFLPYFRIFGLQPSVTLVLLICWLTIRGQEEALYLIPLAALCLGLVDGAPLGVAFLALAPVVALHELRGLHLGEGQLVIAVVFTIVATLIYQSVYYLAFVAGGQSGDIVAAALEVAVPVSLLNVVILFPVYWMTWVFSADVRRTMFA